MKIINKNNSICFLITLLVFSRLIPHPPNFTPIISIVILSGILFHSFILTIIVFFSSMFISDLVIGLYPEMIFTYITLLFIGILFYFFFNKINYKNLIMHSIFGSFIFYLLTNFFVWINSNLYEQTLDGLINCYVLAIPFFSNTLLSTIFFSYLTFTCVDKVKNYFYKIEKSTI